MVGSKLATALAPFPDNNLSPKDYDLVAPLYAGLQNLATSTSRATGVDGNLPTNWPTLRPIDTIFTGNATKLYVKAAVNLTAGNIVNLYNNAGVLNARLANSGSAATMAHGIVTTTVAAGTVAEIQWLRTITQLIGSLTIGALYYISASSGLITATRPSAAGSIIQPVGVALDASTLLVDIPLSYIQL